jgi:hypothetical protein
MNIRFHPLRHGEFPERTRPRKSSLFKVDWRSTLADLERELEYLGASEVVISAGLTDDDIRIDGWPKANARPWHPGVIVSFDSKHGPLRYFCDEYDDAYRSYGRYLTGYQANLRGVSLGLEALRAVDRYGITRRGEQYTGWKQLTSGNGGPTTRAEAETVIAKYGGLKEALFKSHPDHGGSTGEFATVQAARKLLEAL